jgi:hypothetical protein
MTEAMMRPDRGLAARLDAVRCHTLRPGRPGVFAGWDAAERAALLEAATGSRPMSVGDAARALDGYRATVATWVGIDDDTLLDDLAAWIERCAKPPFDLAPYAEALLADIAGAAAEQLGGLSDAELAELSSHLMCNMTWEQVPYSGAAYHAAMSYRALLRRDLG